MVMDFMLEHGCPWECVDLCECSSSSQSSGSDSSYISPTVCDDPLACNSGADEACCYAPPGFECGFSDPCDFVPE